MSSAVTRKISHVDHGISSDGIKFLKRSKLSPSTVKEFVLACLSQLESDKMQVREVNIEYYRDVEESAIEYLKIVFKIKGMNRKDIIDYENLFFANHYETLVKQVLSDDGNATDEQVIAFSQKIMLWFELAEWCHLIFPDYYNIAKNLGGLDIEDAQYVSKDESHFRSGINRLYYSVFQNIMLSFPEFKVKEQEKQVIHQKMLVFLNDIKQFNIARKFARMRELRVQADYFTNTKI